MSKPSADSSSCCGGGGSDGDNNGRPTSLLQLTTRIVAANIEKYPTAAWGVLSESQWDDIITERVVHSKDRQLQQNRAKHKAPNMLINREGHVRVVDVEENSMKLPSEQQHQQTSSLFKDVLLPPISAKHLTQIEQHPNNTHLSKSRITDELLWQRIVNWKFYRQTSSTTSSSMSRPSSLLVPCTIVERQLVECGETLLELVVNYKVLSFDEYVAQRQQQEQQEKQHVSSDRRSSIQSNSSLLLFGEDDNDDDDNDDDEYPSLGDNLAQQYYQHKVGLRQQYKLCQKYLEHMSMKRIKEICYTLSQSPMDIQLLASTKIGKIVTKVIKTLTKLKKRQEELDEEKQGFVGMEEEEENGVDARRIFWTNTTKWDEGPFITVKHRPRSRLIKAVELTVLQFLQKLLLDWKEMASDNGVVVKGAATHPPKKRPRFKDPTQSSNTDNDQCNSKNKLDHQIVTATTCGRDKHISIEQHTIDMTLLHSSPDWRSLYQSLTKRELELRKSHGEKVRATREHLERDRPKIGKVILKKAVGRVRGGDVGGGLLRSGSGGSGGGSSIGSSLAQTSPAKADSTSPSFAMDKRSRQEAILNKSKGLRAIRKQASSGSGIASSKVTQIRQTSKVAAKWSKSSFNDRSSKSFGASVASVASAAGGGGVRKVMQKKDQSQIHVSLQNGKTMKLPSTASTAAGKSSGKYSSLQQKMAAKNRGVKRK